MNFVDKDGLKCTYPSTPGEETIGLLEDGTCPFYEWITKDGTTKMYIPVHPYISHSPQSAATYDAFLYIIIQSVTQ